MEQAKELLGHFLRRFRGNAGLSGQCAGQLSQDVFGERRFLPVSSPSSRQKVLRQPSQA